MVDYIMTLRCADAPGIVHATSEAVVTVRGNILENDQFTDPVTGTFCMRTRFETDSSDVDDVRRRLLSGVARFAPQIGLRRESSRRRAIVMVSRADHCLADLLYRREQGELPLDLVAVVSNHGVCRELSERHGVDFHELTVTPATKAAAEGALRELVNELDVDLIILARYMQILSPELCRDYDGQIVNIHHSFLPGFKGARPYHQAYERGVKLIGATAHFVTGELDEGPIIEQDVVRVTHARRPNDLVTLGRDIERTVLARAVTLLAEDRVTVVGRRTVIFAQ